MMRLTVIPHAAILYPLPNCSVGLVSHNQTAQAALEFLSNLRFFYAQNLLSFTLLCRAGQALARVAGYVWPVDQPVQSGSMIGLMWSGLKLTTNEVTIMTNHAQNPAVISSQTTPKNQALFTLLKRSPTESRIICHDLNFDQATGLAREIPAAIVKFSKMMVL